MDILVYVAAKCDVQYLVAAAYSHDRQLAVGRQAEQYQVVFIPIGIYILQGGNWFFLHVKRVDIATTAHDQPVQPVHYCRQRFDIRNDRDQNRSTSSFQYRLYIGFCYAGKSVFPIGGYSYTGRLKIFFFRNIMIYFPVDGL